MNTFEFDISQKDILKYLGHRGSIIPEDIQHSIDSAVEEVYLRSKPKTIYRCFPYEHGRLTGSSFHAEGHQTLELLQDSSQVILMAVTLGLEMDRLIRSWELRDLSYALILDTTCSAAVEGVIEKLFRTLESQYRTENLYLTDRFSPGYADMPLSVQKNLLETLNASRLIGLSVTQSGLLLPRKSITALSGVCDRPQPHRHPGCGLCPKFYDCSYRKRGITCYE